MASDLEFGGPDWADRKATALINKYPYDERAKLRDGITQSLREAYEQGRKDENEACAEVVEAFVHTRTDCERGTTTQEIAANVRDRINSTPNASAKEPTK